MALHSQIIQHLERLGIPVALRAQAAVVALLLLSGCIPNGESAPASAIGVMVDSSIGSVVRGEVLDKRSGADYPEEVTIRLDAAPVDVGSVRDKQSSLDLAPGDELVLWFSEGDYKVGQTYAFFVIDSSEGTAALYGHDVRTDEPAKEFEDNEGYARVRPVDVLDCLVAEQGNVGDLPRLTAAIQAIRESNELRMFSPVLRGCEFPDES